MNKLALILIALLASCVGAGAQTASFVKTDTVTKGGWQGLYGKDGYSIEAGAQSLPSYASFTPQNSLTWTWTGSTTDTRALQNAGTRIAACWYSSTSFYFDVNITDGATHQVSLYLLDWDTMAGGRKETIQVANAATGAVLASQAYTSFVQGSYAVFSVSGHVHVNVTNNNPSANAVVEGIFFDTAGSTGTVPCVCQHKVGLSWTPIAGATSYNIYRGTISGGPYSKIGSSTSASTTFTDPNVAAGATYWYVITSMSASGESGYGPQLQAVIFTP